MRTFWRVGYARVSTKDQNLALQHEALNKAGCGKVYEDKVSGAKTIRQGLDLTLEVLREGDSLVVWKLDRLGRNVKDLVILVGQLENQGIHFKSLTESIDTSSTSGRFFFHVMACLAQMERELLIERTQAGLEATRKRGRVGGRKRLSPFLLCIGGFLSRKERDQITTGTFGGVRHKTPNSRLNGLLPLLGRPLIEKIPSE